MSNGFRKPAAGAKKDKFKELDVAVKNCEMATRLSQMLIKQLLDQLQNNRLDLDNTMGMINDFQYRTLAMLELSGISKDLLDKRADELKLKDYNSASAREDAAKGYIDDSAGVVGEDSIVTITSSTNGDEDRGIFRSKFPMSECLTPSIKEKIMGLKLGDSFEEQIKNDLHKITIVALSKKVEQSAEGNANDTEENKSN